MNESFETAEMGNGVECRQIRCFSGQFGLTGPKTSWGALRFLAGVRGAGALAFGFPASNEPGKLLFLHGQ